MPVLGALAQFRREVRAGLRTENAPTDILWRAAWRELCAGCWNLIGCPLRAEVLRREAAEQLVQAARTRQGVR